jgi:hypothetical protein
MTDIRLWLLILILLGGCDKFRGEPATLDEITKVVEALRAAGCTAVREIDVDADGYEVEGATCGDGKSYDVKLDKKFAVVSKRADWL